MLEIESNSEGRSTINRDQLITIEDLESFKRTLLDEIKLLLRNSPGHPTKQWLRSTEVRKMLSISPGTLQNLRVNGTLSHSKIGGWIFRSKVRHHSDTRYAIDSGA